jgi:PAS domain-containing protein
MKTLLALSVSLLSCAIWPHVTAAPAGDLKAQFRNPPRECSLMAFWSWNGTLTPEKLTWQIDQMVQQGIYGAFMHARAGLDESETPYFSEGFWNGVRTSVEHAKKVGFQSWIYDEDKWPSGGAGGRTIAANPARNRATGLDHEWMLVQGPARKTIAFTNAQFVIAARSTGTNRLESASLTNLTALNLPDGGGIWDVPPGEWRVSVFRLNYGDHAKPNYLNPDTVREFLNNTYEEYARRFAEHFGKTIPGSFFDEIGNIALAWDPLLAERFRQAKGYDLATSLPLLYFDGGPRTIKVRCDYFEVYTQLFEEAWFKQISAWCARNHLQLTGHTLEAFRNLRDEGDYFRTWRHAQIPGTDNEDFRYTFPRVVGSWKPKQLSSVSHVYGKERAAAESLGGGGWAVTLDQTRYGVNMLSVYGVNFFIFHLFHYSMDRPATMDDWPNSWFYENPYWKYFRHLADYTRRVSFMGRQGEHVADVAILYSVEDVWSRGFQVGPPVEIPGLAKLVMPEITGLATPVVPGLATANTASRPATEQLVDRLLERQIDSDLVDTDSLLQATPGPDGRVKIGKESYRVLLLPAARTVSLAAYRRIRDLSRAGLKVIAVGVTPRHSAENGAEDPEVIRVSQELFGDRPTADSAELLLRLEKELVSDVRVLSGVRETLRCVHRRFGEREVYWLVNSEKRAGAWTIQFAATGSVERWDPATGDITDLSPSEQSSHNTTLRLELKPWEARYIVFHRDGNQTSAGKADRPTGGASLPPLAVEGPWTFQLAPTELDEVWKSDAGETKVELPVMDLRIERGPSPGKSQESDWRRIKIVDRLNPRRGATRYLSAWDAAWITRYIHQDFPGELGGSLLHFQKTFDLAFEPSSAWLTLAAEETFECSINGTLVATGTNHAAPVTLEAMPLKRGQNSINVIVKGGGYLLAQGAVNGGAGKTVAIRTDRTWQVRTQATDGLAAYEFTFPPFGKWGELPLRGKAQPLPAVVWYRAVLPPGARSLNRPDVRGDWEIFLNERPLVVPASGPLPLPEKLASDSVISLRVRIQRAEDGLQAPLVFRCQPARAELGDWQSLGLDWYSGRSVYRTIFDLPAAYAGRHLTLDLGELCYAGEVWLNGKLVNSLVWPPYEVDITRFATAGKNKLVVVAANLLANQMRWDIFDSAIPGQFNRWWHDGSILREAEHLRSGLLGPVRIKAEASPTTR